MADFVPGVVLSERLYRDAVRPLLDEHRPGLAHSAALLGPGSEVLGFDTERSTDHDWGPRLLLFLSTGDTALEELLAERLPGMIAGHPTDLAARRASGPHGSPAVTVCTPGAWLTGQLGFDASTGVSTVDWLATSTQALAEVTGGAVFHDGLGVLEPVRRALTWYPDDMWRYVLACQWRRIGQEDAFAGRCAEVGDDLGSAVVAARLVRELIRLCLLSDRRYPPYGKWLGSAFARLPCAATLGPVLRAALAATDWPERERNLVTAYETAAALHNATGLTAALDPGTRPFHDRPYRVPGADRFVTALLAGITDPAIRDLPLTGAIDQFADSTDAIDHAARARALTQALYPH